MAALLSHPDPDPYLSAVDPSALPRRKDGHAAELPEAGDSEPIGRSTSEDGVVLGIKFTPVPEMCSSPVAPLAAAGAGSRDGDPVAGESELAPRSAPISWPLLLISSYASALTLALVWILWTGRVLHRDRSYRTDLDSGAPSLTSSPGGDFSRSKIPLPPLPATNLTNLGGSLALGDIVVRPIAIEHRSIELIHLQGETGERRFTSPCLVLYLELTNRHRTERFAPLEASFVRDAENAPDRSLIELPDGRGLAMFPLATESEWSIEGQNFTALGPGETGRTVAVSEPLRVLPRQALMTWRVKLRTSPLQTNLLGVRFQGSAVRAEAE